MKAVGGGGGREEVETGVGSFTLLPLLISEQKEEKKNA